jgi:hypothetical protein
MRSDRATHVLKRFLPFGADQIINAPEGYKGEGVKRAVAGAAGIPIYGMTPEERREFNKEEKARKALKKRRAARGED